LLEIQDANITQKSPSSRHRTTLSSCIFATKARISTIGEKLVKAKSHYASWLGAGSKLVRTRQRNGIWLLRNNISSRCSHNMVNFGPLTAEIGSANFNRFRLFASLLQRRHSPEANQTLHDVWPSPGLVHYLYNFGGSCPLNFARCKIHFASQVLHSPILAVLLYGTRAAGVSQNLRHATRNGITELSLTSPPVFVWAVITLGIGPHSS